MTLAKIERVLDFAMVQGLREGDNPARWKGHFSELMSKRPEAENYKAVPYVDVPQLIVRLRDESFHFRDDTDRYRKKSVDLVQRHAPISAQAVEFLILTATRQQEAVSATWDELDLHGALWTIPAARTKSGRPHVVPLSRQAVALLKRREELRTSSAYIFPAQRKTARGPITGGAPLQVLRNLGISPGERTVHGFRSSFKNWACDQTDFADEISEEALAHVVGDQTRRAYRRDSGIVKRRALMQAWADYVGPRKDKIDDIVEAAKIFHFVEEGIARGESREALFAVIREHFKISDRTIKRRLAIIKKARERISIRDCHNS